MYVTNSAFFDMQFLQCTSQKDDSKIYLRVKNHYHNLLSDLLYLMHGSPKPGLLQPGAPNITYHQGS